MSRASVSRFERSGNLNVVGVNPGRVNDFKIVYLSIPSEVVGFNGIEQ